MGWRSIGAVAEGFGGVMFCFERVRIVFVDYCEKSSNGKDS